MYEVKCDNCKATIGTTDSIRRSAEGGLCGSCRYANHKALEAQFARALKAGIGVDVEITLRDLDRWTVSGKHAAVHAATAFLTHRVAMSLESMVNDDELDQTFAYLVSR